MTELPPSRALCRLTLLAALTLSGAAAHAAGSDFVDGFDSASGRWWAANGWSNGAPFAVGWRADQVHVGGGSLTLDLGACPAGAGACSGMSLAGAEYRSSDFYGYGHFETTMQAASGSGVVTGFFTYTGPSDGQPWDEIDVEILGKDPSKLQLNYFVNGVGGHEHVINLGFDASAGLHRYAFDWRADALRWYVDGTEVYSVLGVGTPLPTHAGRIMSNLWAVDASASGWAGSFADGTRATTSIDAISYSSAAAPVPEPASAVLMTLGAIGLLARSRRSRLAR
ncbi:MAG: hypothetical protein RLY71_627 [Pseudomonadota bacterium]|jgi:beta-glucanase (GH16 family)